MSRALWRLLPGVRAGERPRCLFFLALSGLVSLASTLGLAAVEALFLARVGPEQLPLTFVLAAPATVAGTLAYGALVGRRRNDTFFVELLSGGALLAAAGFWAALAGYNAIYPALFCFYFLSYSVLRSHYWTFTSDFFDTLAAKRLFVLFNVGNSLGGVTGGLLAAGLTRLVGAEWLIGAWALLLLAGAVLLRARRRALRRWGPLELEETDESSLSGLGGAIRYSRRTPIGLWLIASTTGMILALVVSQYLYLTLFARSFGSAEALAAFLGLFLAITNGIEVVVELWITPLLIRRVGVAAANLVHPSLTLLSFGALAVEPGLAAGIAARANSEMLENSLAAPLRTLVYQALPLRFRGRIRALLEGIVFYAGMALAGLVLLIAVPRLELRGVALLGGATALLYLLAGWRVRGAYLDTIIARLRERRPDFAELGEELDRLAPQRLEDLWRSLLDETREGDASVLGPLPPVLVRRGILEPVLEAATDPDPLIRRLCLEALGASGDARCEAALGEALGDPDPGVRLAAVRAARERPEPSPLRDRFAGLLDDASPRVRAEAAAAAGEAGHATLRAMAASGDPSQVVAALRRLPRALLGAALDHTQSPDPALRAEALEAASQLAQPVPIPTDRLALELEHAGPAVRLAALRALATRDDPAAHRAIARTLGDPGWEVRRTAAGILAARGAEAIELVEPYLHATGTGTAEAAARALAGIGSPQARELLTAELRSRVREAWVALLSIHVLPADGALAERFLRTAYEDLAVRDRMVAFRLLELIEEAAVMRTVEKVLRFAKTRARADALEVLSNLGDREASALLVLLLEDGSIQEKIPEVASYVRPPRDAAEVVETAQRSSDHWIRAAAAALAGDPIPHSIPEEQMERLLILRQVSLFKQLSLEQLEAINQILDEERYLEGEVILREGDLGSRLYILVEGETEVYKRYRQETEVLLNTLMPVSYFGEMAILDAGPRGATIVATRDSRLLTLDGERLLELILQTPEIAFELFRVLVGMVHRAEERLGHDLRDRQQDAGKPEAEPGGGGSSAAG